MTDWGGGISVNVGSGGCKMHRGTTSSCQ